MNKVTIAGKEYPVRYGLSGTQEALALVKGKDLTAAAKLGELPFDKWAAFVMAGLKNGSKVSKTDPPTLEKVEDALDESTQLFFDCLHFFGEDNTPKNTDSDGSTEEAAENQDVEGN